MTMTEINDNNNTVATTLEEDNNNNGVEEMTTVTAAQVEEVNSKLQEVVKKSQVIQDTADRIQVQADRAFKAAQHYKDVYQQFCRQLLQELIQNHVYSASYNTEYRELLSKKEAFELELIECDNKDKRKELLLAYTIVRDKIERLLIQAVYLGALRDQYMMPETMDSLQDKFAIDNGELNPFEGMSILAKFI